MPEKYIWSDNSAELFQFALNSNTVKDMIDKFKSKSYTMYTKDTIMADGKCMFLIYHRLIIVKQMKHIMLGVASPCYLK
jgi:hypothetical protein